MDEMPVRNLAMLSASDALSPERLSEELAKGGISIPASVIRQKALDLGACHKLGEALFLLPEDVDAILRYGKQTPAPAVDQPEKTKVKAQKHVSEPEPNEIRNVYTPPMLAKRWGCSERHIRNLINEGKLGCFRLGGKLVRIRHSDVEAAEKAFAEDAPVPDETPSKDPANEIMTRARVNGLRAKRLDR